MAEFEQKVQKSQTRFSKNKLFFLIIIVFIFSTQSKYKYYNNIYEGVI